MATYNGHKNWNHWNVALWIGNDEGLYAVARFMVRSHRSLDMAARAMETYLLCEGVAKTPDGAPYSFTAIRAAIRGIR